MPSRRGRPKRSTKATPAATTGTINQQQEKETDESPWTFNHHLLGSTVLQGPVLQQQTADAATSKQIHYVPIDTTMPLVSFCPQQKLDARQPALWRGIVANGSSLSSAASIDEANNKANGNNSDQEQIYMAVDRVAKDLQQQQLPAITSPAAATNITTRATVPFSVTPSSQALSTVEAKLANALYRHVVEDWLPSLTLVAAIEEVNLQFLKQKQREMANGASDGNVNTSKSKASKGAGGVSSSSPYWSIPDYYRKHPNQYLILPPEVMQAQKQQSSSSHLIKTLPVTFTPSQLVARIKQGCRLVYATLVHDATAAAADDVATGGKTTSKSKSAKALKAAAALRRSSVRIAITKSDSDVQQQPPVVAALTSSSHNVVPPHEPVSFSDPTTTWKVVNGGTIALYLKQHLLDEAAMEEHDDNQQGGNGDIQQQSNVDVESTAASNEVIDEQSKHETMATSEVQDATAAMDGDGDTLNVNAKFEAAQQVEEPVVDEPSTSQPPSSPSSVAEEEEVGDNDDEDFEPKNDEEAADDDDDADSSSNAPVYVKENIKDLELEQPEPLAGTADATMEDVAIDEVEDNDDEEDTNPYLALTNPAIMEWLGRKTSKLLTVSDLQSVFHVLLLRENEAKKKKRRVAIGDMGEDATSLLSPVDELIWERILSASLGAAATGTGFVSSSSRLVLKLAEPHEDDNVTDWETQYFGRSNFVVGIAHDDDGFASDVEAQRLAESARLAEQEFKRQKAHDLWRYKGIHGGYTIWPSWSDTVEEYIEQKRLQSGGLKSDAMDASGERTSEDAAAKDFALAQTLADEAAAQDAASGRRTRRGGESDVFYGSQSNMTPKQLMDTILRLTSQKGFQTAVGLLSAVPDESTDPLRRIRTALGRLVWKRNQLGRLTVDTNTGDKDVLATLASRPLLRLEESGLHRRRQLCQYLRQLHETELYLRQLVLQNMSQVPIAIIATAADERPGSMESMDDTDYEDPSLVEWHSSGHELIGQKIYRPAQQHNTDERSACHWYRVMDYAPSLALAEDAVESAEQQAIGNAKEPTPVERRMRFRAISVSGADDKVPVNGVPGGVLLLTEAQTRAGVAAAEMYHLDNVASRSRAGNVFANAANTKIALIAVDNEDTTQSRNYTIVGHDSLLDRGKKVQHRILILPEASLANAEATWATLLDGATACKLDNSSIIYTIQQFDYDSSSPAFQECQKIIKFLQRQDKAGLFLRPVDPIALNIPTYRSVVEHPMDVSTVESKLQYGDYANILPGQSSHRTTIGRMLNGPFKSDVELVFDNAMLFNPPGDWVHVSAEQLKTAVLKRIEQATVAAEGGVGVRSRQSSSIYVDEDSDVDVYVYESDQDEEYGQSRRNKKRKQQPPDSIPREDASARAIERSWKLQKIITESAGLGGPLASLPVNTDAATFALSSQWTCRLGVERHDIELDPIDQDDELDGLVAMYQQVDEQEATGLRRSTRAQLDSGQPTNVAMSKRTLTYVSSEPLLEPDDRLPTSRLEVEHICEKVHEAIFANAYRDCAKELISDSDIGLFADDSFPPYLGRVIPVNDGGDGIWEIRSPLLAPALRWVIRGLIHSGHLGEVEPITMDSLSSGSIICNHAYFVDDRQPFDVIDIKELQRRKRAGQETNEHAEEEIELSEYEKLRAERVARNADRLKALGLA
ncbi:hypothetical protein MPSEU_001082200 [Mayamaea pseudoterrestris]|nr:hypothetical protein MPSEU_001082200 [Mayamaea pseudoterrestris]